MDACWTYTSLISTFCPLKLDNMERETRKAWENWSNKIIFSGYCFSDLIDTHKQRDYNLCLRVLGNWKRLPFRLTKRCICSKFMQKNNCSHLRSCPVTFKFLSFRFFTDIQAIICQNFANWTWSLHKFLYAPQGSYQRRPLAEKWERNGPWDWLRK